MLAGAAHVAVDEEDFAADFGDGDGEVGRDGGFAFGGAGTGEDEGLEFGVEGVLGGEEDRDEGGTEAFGDGGGFALPGFEFEAVLEASMDWVVITRTTEAAKIVSNTVEISAMPRGRVK